MARCVKRCICVDDAGVDDAGVDDSGVDGVVSPAAGRRLGIAENNCRFATSPLRHFVRTRVTRRSASSSLLGGKALVVPLSPCRNDDTDCGKRGCSLQGTRSCTTQPASRQPSRSRT